MVVRDGADVLALSRGLAGGAEHVPNKDRQLVTGILCRSLSIGDGRQNESCGGND